jgi:predicted RND superfamily exporter protein
VLVWARAWRRSILAAALVLTAVGFAGLRSLSFDSDILHLLPKSGRAVPAFDEFLKQFGSLDYLYVVFEAPADHRIDEYADRIEAFVEKLEKLPEIERVDAGLFGGDRDWSYIGDRELLLLSPERLREAIDRFGPRMPSALAQTRELLSVPSPEITQMVRQDPLGLFFLLRQQLEGAAGGLKMDSARGGYVTKDGRSRLVMARPTRPPFDTEFSKQLFAQLGTLEKALNAPAAAHAQAGAHAGAVGGAAAGAAAGAQPDAEAEADDEELPPLTVQFAGGHRISLETEQQVRTESIWNSAGSLLVILPLLFFAFRSPWLVLVGALPSALAMLLVLGAYGATGTTLSGAAAGAAAMLFGLGIDGVVLLFVAFRHQVSTGLSADEATVALEGPSASMLLGMWTTAATFYGLVVIDFPSLQELGLLIGHGMVLCGLLTLVLVPALFPKRIGRLPPPLTAWWLSRLVSRHSRAILVTAAIATAALGVAATRAKVDASLDKLKSTTKGALFEEEVAKRFGLPRDVYLVIARGSDLESLLVENERLVADLAKEIPRLIFHGPSSLLPSAARQRDAAGRIQAAGLTAPALTARLTAAAGDAGFRADTFAPFLDRLPRLLNPEARLTYEGFRQQGLEDLLSRTIVRAKKPGAARGSDDANRQPAKAGARAAAAAAAGAGAGSAARPDAIAGSEPGTGAGANSGASAGARGAASADADAGDFVLATYVYPPNAASVPTLRRIVESRGAAMTLTGLPEVNRELAARFTPEFLKGLGVGTVLVIILVVASFKRLDLTLLALLPTVLALIWAAGLMALAGTELDLFSVFAVMTFVGIGVDYGIHLVHEFHRARRDQREEVIARLGPVILVAGGITLLGYGTLITSSYAPLRSLGLVSAVMVGTLMVSSLIVLPALLIRRRE